jgi:hypothetical protein
MRDIAPTAIVSALDLARALKINRATATELIVAEAAGPAFVHGQAGFTYATAISDLQGRGPADVSVPALNVKVRAAHWSEAEHRFVGWHARLSDDEVEAAIGRWWPVRNAEVLKGSALVATIGGWVVAVRMILAVETDRGQRSFRLDKPTKMQRNAYYHRRLAPQPGSLIQRLGGV